MAFYLTKEREQDVVGSYERYQKYLHEHQQQFPPNAYKLATAEWYYNPNDHRCPHDAWLESCMISETAESDRRRITGMRIRVLGAYHDGYIELLYTRIFSYAFESPSSVRGLGNWLYDEFRLSKRGNVIHEIEWAGFPEEKGSRWIIEASDVEFRWCPQVSSNIH